MSGRDASRRETVLFLLGLASSIIPWGLGLIGVVMNVWLGGFILAAGFFLIAYSLWVWIGGRRWRKFLRAAVVIIAGIGYFGLIGHQIVSDIRKRPPHVESKVDKLDNRHNVQLPRAQMYKSLPAENSKPTAKPLAISLENVMVVNSRMVDWKITNWSGRVVYDATYFFMIFDMDQPHLNDIVGAASLPISPIETMVQKIDFINPHDSASGLLFPFEICQRIRAGDRLFGTASLNCPGCRERAYWVYVMWGRGGWFAEMRGYDTRGLKVPIGAIIANPTRELQKLVPAISRMAIRDNPTHASAKHAGQSG